LDRLPHKDPYKYLSRYDRYWLYLMPGFGIPLLWFFWSFGDFIDKAYFDIMIRYSIGAIPEMGSIKFFLESAICATLGSYARTVLDIGKMADYLESGGTLFVERLQTGVAGIVGISVYFLLQDHFFIKILYKGSMETPPLSAAGVCLSTILAGFLSREVTGIVIERFQREAVGQPSAPAPSKAHSNSAPDTARPSTTAT